MSSYNLDVLPQGSSPDRLEYPHFPTLYQLVIWRNLNLVPMERIAKTLECSVEQVKSAALAMGLTVDESLTGLFLERGFQTIIRRNWDILPYEQILDLLEWTPEQLAYILKEDDFFWVKLGFGKPRCAPVKYAPLTPAQQERTAEIHKVMESCFGDETPAKEQPFDFLKHYGKALPLKSADDRFDLKMVYSYSALYGDPLLDPEIGSYPEEMLADYAAAGVNAVWMQITLYTLLPYLGEDLGISDRWEERLENLKKLVARGKKYGVDIILYFNEPRAMPPELFKKMPYRMGARIKGFDDRAICCSDPRIINDIENAVCELFTRVPGLGGLFTITMSENLTHCKAREDVDIPCPHCANVPTEDLVISLNCAIERGMHRAAPDAKFLVYTWAWEPEWMEKAIRSLPESAVIMTVSETLMPTYCKGIEGYVWDYSISKVGPGETAKKQWKCALESKQSAMAKVQLNNSWELSAVPYIPVANLIERHLDNLSKEGVRNLMLCWTLGGFPGGNLELLTRSKEELAAGKFGAAADSVLKAWKLFSDAFEQFPFCGSGGIYSYPGNFGPMSLLHKKPTFRHASMVGFPYDDLYTWRCDGFFPESVFTETFTEMCDVWQQGIDELQNAISLVSGRELENLNELKNIAICCYCHFKTTLNQSLFVQRRRENLSCKDIYEDEIRIALLEREAMRKDSRIGYEASNHYYFTQNDLAEKVINCQYLLDCEQA